MATNNITIEIRRGDYTTGSITAFGNGAGGTVIVHSAAHGLSNGEGVEITGTTNYNGVFVISSVTTNTFHITKTWVTNDATGTWGSNPRVSKSTVRANIEMIKLQIDEIQDTINKDIIITPIIGSTCDAYLFDEGMHTESFTTKGTITNDSANNVSAVYIKDDLRYAEKHWQNSGISTLKWTDEGDTGVTNTYTGYLQRAIFGYTAGKVNLYSYSLVFIQGRKA